MCIRDSLISFLGAWRAKLWRARFCYWVMDFNPDEAIAAGWLRADSFTATFLERLSMFSLRRANKIIALDRFMRDQNVYKRQGMGKDTYTADESSRYNLIRGIWAGRGNKGQKVLEIIITGYDNQEQARQALMRQLAKLIKVEK